MSESTNPEWVLRARLALWTGVPQARKYPVFSGFRPGWWIPDDESDRGYHDGEVVVLSSECIRPGEEGIIHIYPLVPELWQRVIPGMDIEMCEGPYVIGLATVISIEPRPPQSPGIDS